MPQDAASNSRIVAAWRAHTPGSAELAQQAAGLLPSGITHDARRQDPYGPYIARAQGGHKATTPKTTSTLAPLDVGSPASS